MSNIDRIIDIVNNFDIIQHNYLIRYWQPSLNFQHVVYTPDTTLPRAISLKCTYRYTTAECGRKPFTSSMTNQSGKALGTETDRGLHSTLQHCHNTVVSHIDRFLAIIYQLFITITILIRNYHMRTISRRLNSYRIVYKKLTSSGSAGTQSLALM